MKRYAEFSDCGMFRYGLGRSWDQEREPRTIGFVMLNPSTADAYQEDPTITRCIGFAQREGFNNLLIANLYAFKATDSDVLEARIRRGHDATGPENDAAIAATRDSCDSIVCAWGTKGRPGRESAVWRILESHPRVYCLGLSKGGHPLHPLYLKKTTPLIPFKGPPA